MTTELPPAAIATLRAEYSKIKAISLERVAELRTIIGKGQDTLVSQLVGANIRFVSTLARSEAARRGLNL